ncbi:MAG: YfhO family protein, partial [Eubacterium sp.]
MHSSKDASILKKAAPYLIITAAMLAAVLWLTEGGKYIYGTLDDWEIQHTTIPELLRRQFYQTGNLFPDFIPSVGGGENAYYFSYYGLLSPVILLSYLFPFLRMRTYLMAAAILAGFLAPCLIYRWLSRICRPAAALTAALLFEFAAGFFHHGHYHIMFIYYMPFLIMALHALEGQIRHGKGSAGFVIWMSLTILCCYYFAVAEFAAAGVYAVYLGLCGPESEGSAGKRAFRAVLKMIPGSILTVMLTAVLWLPTLYALAGRSQSQTTVSLKELLTPVFHGEYMMYDVDSMGVTAFFLAAVCFFLLKKNAGARWLSVIFLILAFSALPVFVLNGGMYVHGKVLFAFLPLAAMMEAEFLEKLLEGDVPWKKLFLLLLPLGALCYFTFGSKYRVCFLADFCLTVLVLVVFAAGKRRPLLLRTGMAVLLIPALVVTVSINHRKPLIKSGGTLAVPKFQMDQGTYRTGYLMGGRSPFNLPAENGEYLASIYSSVSNPYYGRYYHSQCGNNVRYRNSAMMDQTKNPYFCMQMGVRYLIARNPYTAPENYHLVKRIRNYRLYENKNVLPIAYTSGTEFNPRQQKAKRITVPGMKTTYRIHSKVLQEKILHLKPSSHDRIITISGVLKNYRTRSKVKFGVWQRRQMIQDHTGDVK